MKTRSKDLGTDYESSRADFWGAWEVPAGRLPEGGRYDLGDLWIGQHPETAIDAGWFVEEDKARANLNPHRALAAAIAKAGHERVLLAHKRLVRKPGNSRRSPDGMREIVVVSPNMAARLVATYLQHNATCAT